MPEGGEAGADGAAMEEETPLLRPEPTPSSFDMRVRFSGSAPATSDPYSVLRGCCPVASIAPGMVPCTSDFSCSGREFRLRLWCGQATSPARARAGGATADSGGGDGLCVQLQCLKPDGKGTYVQAVVGVRRSGADDVEVLLHQLFRRPPPWGRTVRNIAPHSMLADRNEGFARRREVESCGRTLCVEFEVRMRVVEERSGGYHITKLPLPPQAKHVVSAPEDAWRQYRHTMETVAGTFGSIVRVSAGVNGAHAALWSRGFPPAGPEGGCAWEYRATVRRPPERVGLRTPLKVGLINGTRFMAESPSLLEHAVWWDADAGCVAAIGSGRLPADRAPGDVVSVRVWLDTTDGVVRWSIDGGPLTKPLSLPRQLRGPVLHPVVLLSGLGDECEMHGLTDALPPEEAEAVEEEDALLRVFERSDEDGDGFISPDEFRKLALRTGHADAFDPQAACEAVRGAQGVEPQGAEGSDGEPPPCGLDIQGLRLWYDRGPWHLLSDADALLTERRCMGGDPPRYGTRREFEAEGLDWGTAAPMPDPAMQQGPAAADAAPPDLRRDPADERWKEKDSFLAAPHTEEEWEAAERPPPFDAALAVTAAFTEGGGWRPEPVQGEPTQYVREADGARVTAAGLLTVLMQEYYDKLRASGSADAPE